MKGGKLRHRVTIQEPVETQNDYGEPEIRWQNVATAVQVSIEPLRGREYFTARQEVADVTVRIEMRYRSDISVKQKIVHGPVCACNTTLTEEFLIEAHLDIMERHRELHLMCRSFVA